MTVQLADELSVSDATFFRHLAKLRDVNYIGKTKKKVYYLRGYGTLIDQFKLPKTRKVILRQEYLVNKEYFRPYLVCAFAGSECINYKIDLRRGEPKKDGLYQPRQESKILRIQRNYACSLSARFLENVTGFKRSSNSSLMNKGVELGFIYKEEDREFIGLPASEIHYMRSEWEIGAPFPVIHKGYVWLRHPDKYLPKLIYKRGRYYR